MTTDPLSAFDPINGMPVTIVFGSFNYRATIYEWINYAASSCDHWRIVCVDQELVNWLHEIGHGACAIYFHNLFPDKQQNDLSTQVSGVRYKNILQMRIKLWRALAGSGRDFINSDADAFWLRDPRPWLMQHTEFDILASQNLTSPKYYYFRYGFALCCGFFLCRANARTHDYFRQVEIRGRQQGESDQAAMNYVLLDSKMHWNIHQPTVRWAILPYMPNPKQDKKVTWREISFPGITIMMRMNQPIMQLMRSVHWLLRLRLPWREHAPIVNKYLLYIYVSREIMRSKLSTGLTIGAIPLHLVTRHNIYSSPLFVHHRDSNKKHNS